MWQENTKLLIQPLICPRYQLNHFAISSNQGSEAKWLRVQPAIQRQNQIITTIRYFGHFG